MPRQSLRFRVRIAAQIPTPPRTRSATASAGGRLVSVAIRRRLPKELAPLEVIPGWE